MSYNKRGSRRWLSLSQYIELYPGDNVWYEKPDFRDKPNICKWCGKEILDKRRTTFCKEECSINFNQATTWYRGHSSLPYRILCRDKFVCRNCGLDMAMVNKHGMKIPTGIGAEVHHIVPVSEGGTDHQDNLITLCEDCHNEDHGGFGKVKRNSQKILILMGGSSNDR